MGTGPQAVIPGDMMNMGGEFNLGYLFHPDLDITSTLRKKRPAYVNLLKKAVGYLREEGIYFPNATLQVRPDCVVMHGVPNAGEVLVCAIQESAIENCL